MPLERIEHRSKRFTLLVTPFGKQQIRRSMYSTIILISVTGHLEAWSAVRPR